MRESAIISLIVAVAFLGFRIFDGLFLRKDAVARSGTLTTDDKGTSRFIQFAIVVSWLLMLLAALLDQFRIGIVEPHLLFTAIGVALMAVGITLRVVAMQTLGKFFTRTLRIREEQHVVSTGIYRRVRHPGYLGDMFLFVGSGIGTANFITTILILGVILPAFTRRIAVEERMLVDQLGEEYSAYQAKTWRLIPFVF